MFDIINRYCEWNSALWGYFFPSEEENAILYIDETILTQVAERNHIRIENDQDLTRQFLSSTLFNAADFQLFKEGWAMRMGDRSTGVPIARTWDKLVISLIPLKADGYPAYFAMLCAIMLLASLQGANHKQMKEKAKEFLGENYSSNPGMLIDPLLQQLHTDHPSFNPDRMICGSQRHMSRIKYHLVLKKSMREDFVDFLEVNNLQWQYESYTFFVNNILVPALEKAGKNDLTRIIIKEENIPYVKNILRGKLNFGKKSSQIGNPIQDKVVKWGYELYFDFDGSHSFSVISEFYNLPFNLSLKQGVFEVSEEPSTSDYIAKNVRLAALPSKQLDYEGNKYVISNLGDGTVEYGARFYFEQISDDIYRQVDAPVSGKNYYVFIKKTARLKPFEKKWDRVSDVQESEYDVYFVQSYSAPTTERRNLVKTEDSFQLCGLGSWFSVALSEGQSVFWRPNQVGRDYEPVRDLLKGKDNKRYFRLSPTTSQHLSGDLLIREGKNDLVSEQVSCDFEWGGIQTNYHMNGWGEITGAPIDDKSVNSEITRKQILQNNLGKKSDGSDILLQILYDLADSSGCVSVKKMRAAIEFALPFFGIIPTESNRKSVIYALRRLGYIMAYYDIDRKEYINQLISKYVERSNYSFQGVNAYVVKGVYSQSNIDSLLDGISSLKIYRKRPYDNGALITRPEYACLPDVILFEGNPNKQWLVLDYPVADCLISNMENMRDFASRFGINNGGESLLTIPLCSVPCMVKDNKGNEILCTKDKSGKYVIHKYYELDGKLRPLPKQLARTFCQNSKNTPICLLKYSNVTKRLDVAKISFVAGMGLPSVLDVALCDLSLGMPNIERVFIVDQERTIGIPSNPHNPTIEKKNYSTTATSQNYQSLHRVIAKVSGREVSSDLASNESIVCSYQENNQYKMKYTINYAGKLGLLSLFDASELLAFAIGDKVYYKAPGDSDYCRLGGSGLNEIFSSIILKKVNLIKQEKFDKEIPTHPQGDKTIIIPVIEKHIN